MLKHAHAKGFKAAALTEYTELRKRGTFEIVNRTNDMEPLPLIWVFSYKFDTDGKLLKYKARLCVRGDLQKNSIY